MIKVLITGFRHSGTTMLHQLIKAHPQVGWIENEESYIEFNKPKEWILMFAKKSAGNLKKNVWGEKIPWGTRLTDIGGKRAISMINKWLKYFKRDARVIHILRHPLDVSLSGTGIEGIEKTLRFINKSVPKVIDVINSNKRCSTIVYEDLVENPVVHLHNIFDFLQIMSDLHTISQVINTPLKFGKINTDRVFAHKKLNLDIKVDYNKLIDSLKNRL
jgi:hypothetical protein